MRFITNLFRSMADAIVQDIAQQAGLRGPLSVEDRRKAVTAKA